MSASPWLPLILCVITFALCVRYTRRLRKHLQATRGKFDFLGGCIVVIAKITCFYIPVFLLGTLLLLGVGEHIAQDAPPEDAPLVMREASSPIKAIESLDYFVGHFCRAAVVEIPMQDSHERYQNEEEV